MKLSILIPFLNEEENITFLFQELEKNLVNYDVKPEVIFINDGSTDNSLVLLETMTPKNFNARVINLSKNFGSHAALRAGIVNASGDFISFIYADLQDPLDLLPKLLILCKEGNDIVWACRKKTKNNFVERTFSNFYSFMMKRYALSSYPDNGFDIVMFNKKVQENLNSNIEANSSIFLQILSLGYKQATVDYDKNARIKGKSKWTFSKKIKLLVDSFVAFSYVPIRLVSYIGILFLIFGLSWSTYLVGRKLIYNDLESGWPTLVAILMVGFGTTNISLGIIAEYLWRTLDVSRKRPVFIIKEIINLDSERS